MTETATHGKDFATSEAQEVQSLLRDREMRFARINIGVDEIDADASTRNQARMLPVHQETIEIYRAAMEAGDKFPPIVVNGTKKPYVILDGNHRMFAAKMAGFTSMDAFVVTSANKAQMELFTYEANAKHGLPTSVEERVKQGMYLVSLGNTAANVARALSVPERRLWEALQIDRTERRLTRLGVDSSRFSGNIKRRIGNIRSDVVLQPAAELIVRGKMGTDDINEMVSTLNKLNTEADQVKYIDELREYYRPIIESTAGGKIDLPQDVVRLRMAAKLLRNIDEANLAGALDRLAPEYRAFLAKEVVESVSALLTASGLLKVHAA